MKRFRKRTVIYITITAILLSLFSVSSLTLAAFATDDGESSAVFQPEYTPAPVLPIEMVVPSDALYMNYPDVAAALECLPVEPLPDTVTLFQYFERLQTVQWLEAEIDYAEMPADEAAALTDTYVTSFYTRAKELGLDKYVPINSVSTFDIRGLQNGVTYACWQGKGSPDDPYLIQSQHDLEFLAYAARGSERTLSNVYFKQTVTIDLTDSYLNLGQSWTPIGGYAPIYDGSGKPSYDSTLDTNKTFCGHYDGAGCSIKGLYIGEGSYVGLFGILGPGAVVENVTVSGTILGDEMVGGIAGYAYGNDAMPVSILGCKNEATIKGNSRVGGIVGWAEKGTVSTCTNGGEVRQSDAVDALQSTWPYDDTAVPVTDGRVGANGGIVGLASNTVVSNCENTAIVSFNSADSPYVGGVVGLITHNTLVTNCENAARLNAVHYGGGIVGAALGTSAQTPQIIYCTNYSAAEGVQTSDVAAGGILGYGDTVIVRACENKVPVQGYMHVGGIVGQLVAKQKKSSYASKVEDCINGGQVSTIFTSKVGGKVGGIVGTSGFKEEEQSDYSNDSCYVYYCRNYGDVRSFGQQGQYSEGGGGARVGGLIGMAGITRIEACTNDADVYGGTRVGGLVGEMHFGRMMLCHATNKVIYLMGCAPGLDLSSAENWDGQPIAGGIVGLIVVNSGTQVTACLMEMQLRGYTYLNSEGRYRNVSGKIEHTIWKNYGSRFGWGKPASGYTDICHFDENGEAGQSNAYKGSGNENEAEFGRRFYLLIDKKENVLETTGWNGIMYGGGNYYGGNANQNQAAQLMPSYWVNRYGKTRTNYTYIQDAAASWYYWENNLIAIPDFGGDIDQKDPRSQIDYAVALNYWTNTSTNICGGLLSDGLKNEYKITFNVDGKRYLSLNTFWPNDGKYDENRNLSYALGSNNPSNVTIPSGTGNIKTYPSVRDYKTESENADAADSEINKAGTNLGTITIQAPNGLTYGRTIVGSDDKRYYFLGYKDEESGRWYQPGDQISQSILFRQNIVLTAQWVSGYSVRYALGDKLKDMDGVTFAPLPDSNLYRNLDVAITVLTPSHTSTPVGRFSYWSLNADGTGTRYYPGERHTLSELGVSDGEVVFYFAQPVWDLTVNAQMNGPYVEGSFIEGQTDFVYTLENESIEFRLQFIVPAQQSVTITEIPANVGNYTLTQHSGWAWKYQSKKGIIQYNDNGTWVDWESDFGPFTDYVTFAPYNGKDINVTFINAYYNGVYNTNLKGGVA